LDRVFTSSGIAHAGGPAFQWNILNYGQITNNVRLQDAKLQQQLLVDYQNAVLAAEQQVDDGISAFIQSRSQAEYLRRSADAADGSLNVAKTQYQSGMTDFTTVLVAEQPVAEQFGRRVRQRVARCDRDLPRARGRVADTGKQ
jgi:outer membrane protein TolC